MLCWILLDSGRLAIAGDLASNGCWQLAVCVRFGWLVETTHNHQGSEEIMDKLSLKDTLDFDFQSEAVVIVDPYSTGCLVAKEMAKRGCVVLALWTRGFSPEMKTHVPVSCGPSMNYFAELDEQETLEATALAVREAVGSRTLVACLAGGEAGVDLADALSEHLQLRTNGTQIPNRRDKKVQQELIRKMGLRSVRQAGSDKFEDVEPFLRTESYPIVLKPNESAGSDGVKLCYTFEEAKEHFHVLMKSQMVNGGECPAVLCQEFLRGKEYVVDHVSRDGIHKTMMVWVYDKRPANGAAFVYYGCDPVDANSPEAQVLIPYVRGVLDALGLRNGPSHGEVIMTDEGPCLVEMNCRARGGDGLWKALAKALTGGYTQVDATADCYLDEFQFQKLPDRPPSPFKASGQEVIFVSHSKGLVLSTPGYDVIRQLPSFVALETSVKPGRNVSHTVDLLTGIGSVILMHKDAAVLKRDVEFVRYMEEINGFFVYEAVPETLRRPDSYAVERIMAEAGPNLLRYMSNDRQSFLPMKRNMTTVDSSKEVVVIVDPYSTGCLVAAEYMKRGYSVMALWTMGFSEEMKKHVPLSVGQALKYFKQVDEQETLTATVDHVKSMSSPLKVVACVAGGEAGVDLADALSEALGVRSNGTLIPNKRDKKLQQELIRKIGLRSVRQAGGDKFEDVEPFLKRETYPVVVKPVESAGSDGVKLCHSFEEAQDHFHLLMNSQMVNGGDCPAVLCQEFLRGKEYVIDHVSRDGVHKTTMVWVYDKRPANGSAFVYYGCVPVDSESMEAKILIAYVRRVLDALQIKNGPSHGEVIMTDDGPCLVEMNCRANGGDGAWHSIALAVCGGYSQVEVAVDAFVDKRQFQMIPDKPPSPFKGWGQDCYLISSSKGVVKATPGFDVIRQLPSFMYLETGVQPGQSIDYTVDLVTCAGHVVLMHPDAEVVKQDIVRIRALESSNQMFELEAGHVRLTSSASGIWNSDVVTQVATNRPDLY